jgi:hypothetical protein
MAGFFPYISDRQYYLIKSYMVQEYIAATLVITAIAYSMLLLVRKVTKKKNYGHDCSTCDGCPLKEMKSECNKK